MGFGLLRPIARGYFGFQCDQINNGNFGFVKKVSGGGIVGELATHNCGPSNKQVKQITNTKINEISVEIGMGMSRGMYEWINQSIEHSYQKYNGTITYADADRRIVWQRKYYDALVTEITIPTLDGSSTDNAYFTVKLQPTRVEEIGGGGRLEGEIAPEAAQKHWTAGRWRLNMQDLGTGAAKIESFSWKQSVTQYKPGDQWACYEQCPTKMEVSNIKVSLGLQYREDWHRWYNDFVVMGNCGMNNHKAGNIEFLSPKGFLGNAPDILADIMLNNVGILSLDDGSAEANADGVAQFDAELYCEDIRFNHNTNYVGA